MTRSSADHSDGNAIRPLAVVTGASSGIGFELAKIFAREGYDLLINAEDDKLEIAADAIRESGANVETVQSDLATKEGIHELTDTIQRGGRAVKALILNAGVGVGGDFVNDTKLDDELKLIATNVIAPVHIAKHVLPGMVENGGGYVLITASIAAIMPCPYEAVYGASKAFDKVFSESLRAELEDRNVKVTALMPGPTETNFFHRADMDNTSVGAAKKDDPADVAEQGYQALMAGKDHVVAGSLKTRAQAFVSENLLPETVKAKMHKGMSKPGSAKGKPPTKMGKSGNPEASVRGSGSRGTGSKRASSR